MSDNIIITRDDPNVPEGCRPGDVAEFVLRFLDHLNDGEINVKEFFVPQDRFSWYSVTTGNPKRGNPKRGGDHFWGEDLHVLPDYFEQRRREGEQIALTTLFVHSNPDSLIANVVFELKRTASDLRALGVDHDVATGKGGIDCENDRIIQWSVFQPQEPDGSTSQLCPQPSVAVKGRAVVCGPPSS